MIVSGVLQKRTASELLEAVHIALRSAVRPILWLFLWLFTWLPRENGACRLVCCTLRVFTY